MKLHIHAWEFQLYPEREVSFCFFSSEFGSTLIGTPFLICGPWRLHDRTKSGTICLGRNQEHLSNYQFLMNGAEQKIQGQTIDKTMIKPDVFKNQEAKMRHCTWLCSVKVTEWECRLHKSRHLALYKSEDGSKRVKFQLFWVGFTHKTLFFWGGGWFGMFTLLNIRMSMNVVNHPDTVGTKKKSRWPELYVFLLFYVQRMFAISGHQYNLHRPTGSKSQADAEELIRQKKVPDKSDFRDICFITFSFWQWGNERGTCTS